MASRQDLNLRPAAEKVLAVGDVLCPLSIALQMSVRPPVVWSERPTMKKDQRPPGRTHHARHRDARPSEGKHVTQFSVTTTECAGNGKERPEYQSIVKGLAHNA